VSAPAGPTSTLGATLALVHIVEFPDRTIAATPSQFRYLPRFAALLHGLGEGVQAAEDDGFVLVSDRRLDNAEGASLDQWGAIVGEQRGALDDGDYRRFIRARILANRCLGTCEDLIAIFAIITAPSVVELRPLYPAGYQITAFRESAWMSATVRSRVAGIMADAHPSGVGWALVEALPGWLGFSDRDPLDPGGPSSPLDVGILAREIV